MPWTEVVIGARRRELRHMETALTDLGALSVTVTDAGDEPILEPGPGATPLWRELNVTALFPAGLDRRGFIAAFHELTFLRDDAGITFRDVADAEWTRAWMADFRPMRFGARLWVVPGGMALPVEANATQAVVVALDPGLAFGSGTHATTALCLDWLEALARTGALAGRSVLDYGAGSGILGIAALKLGAARAVFVDNDPQALIAIADNLARNDIDAAGAVMTLPDNVNTVAEARAGCDVVVANILAGTLVALRPTLLAATKAGARVALPGCSQPSPRTWPPPTGITPRPARSRSPSARIGCGSISSWLEASEQRAQSGTSNGRSVESAADGTWVTTPRVANREARAFSAGRRRCPSSERSGGDYW